MSELKTIKFQLMLSQSEADAIDEWSFSSRIRTRAEAIRRLCQMGIGFDRRRHDLSQTARDLEARIDDLNKATAVMAAKDDASDEEKAVMGSVGEVLVAFMGVREVVFDLLWQHANFINEGGMEEKMEAAAEIEAKFQKDYKDLQDLINRKRAEKS